MIKNMLRIKGFFMIKIMLAVCMLSTCYASFDEGKPDHILPPPPSLKTVILPDPTSEEGKTLLDFLRHFQDLANTKYPKTDLPTSPTLPVLPPLLSSSSLILPPPPTIGTLPPPPTLGSLPPPPTLPTLGSTLPPPPTLGSTLQKPKDDRSALLEELQNPNPMARLKKVTKVEKGGIKPPKTKPANNSVSNPIGNNTNVPNNQGGPQVGVTEEALQDAMKNLGKKKPVQTNELKIDDKKLNSIKTLINNVKDNKENEGFSIENNNGTLKLVINQDKVEGLSSYDDIKEYLEKAKEHPKGLLVQKQKDEYSKKLQEIINKLNEVVKPKEEKPEVNNDNSLYARNEFKTEQDLKNAIKTAINNIKLVGQENNQKPDVKYLDDVVVKKDGDNITLKIKNGHEFTGTKEDIKKLIDSLKEDNPNSDNMITLRNRILFKKTTPIVEMIDGTYNRANYEDEDSDND